MNLTLELTKPRPLDLEALEKQILAKYIEKGVSSVTSENLAEKIFEFPDLLDQTYQHLTTFIKSQLFTNLIFA